MIYCTRCLVPGSKPYVSFDDEGVCAACRAHERKNDVLAGIDWDDRRRQFDEVVAEAKARKAPYYDVVIPVAGGKDSISQVARVLPHDVRILAVHVDYGIKTEIGIQNLACIPRMGANLSIYRPQEPLHTRLIELGFVDFGDPDLLSHTLLHAYPLHMALRFEVPLVVLGENSAAEYGGAADIAASTEITRAWFETFAANAGHDARFVSKEYGIPFEDLVLYDFPDELPESATRATFLSHYFHWDSETNLEIAKGYGFQALDHPGEGTFRNYVGIDEKINRIHQYMKLLKFGYGRATDHACEDIRNGRLSREEAKELVRAHELVPLSEYYADDFCRWLGMSRTDFDATLEHWRNREIWQRDASGAWVIPGYLEDETAVEGAR